MSEPKKGSKMRKGLLSVKEYTEQMIARRVDARRYKAEMQEAELLNDLHQYRIAKRGYDAALDDISWFISQIHPNVPRRWFDELGFSIVPDIDDEVK